MNIYEKYEFLVNNGWTYAEGSITPHVLTHFVHGVAYGDTNLERLIHKMYMKVSDKNEYL